MMELHSTSTDVQTTTGNSQFTPVTNESNTRVYPWLVSLAYFWGSRFVIPAYFGQIQIIGRENIPPTGPVILAPTHRARWDSLLLPYAVGRLVTGRDMRFMVTSSECQGIQGWFILRMGGFPVDVNRPAIATLRHAIELMQQGEMLVIYPEGGIHRDGKVYPLKLGVARLALLAESSYPNLGIEIVPIGINYSQAHPQWGTNVKIHIGVPLKVADYISGSLKDNAKSLTADLSSRLTPLSINYPENRNI
jgi:1-acyl-sn-glycerol-3-phosphate acyltransferase